MKTLFALQKTTHHKKTKIGAMALAAFIRTLVDESPTMSLKVARDLFDIADEMDALH